MSWNLSKLGDNCTITSSRRFHLDERKKEGVPFYSSKEVIQLCNGESITDCQYISDEAYEDVKCRFGVPKENDLLLTTRGTYGIPYLYRSSDKFYFSDGNLTWFKDFGESLDSKFLYYWFKSSEGWGKVDSIAKGTAQKAVPIDALKDLEIPLPPLPIQRRIADILSAYDDLIENNQRQIKLLEEAAMQLYREWFVFMRFPGHESVRIEDGVPEGWEVKQINDVCLNCASGGTPSRKRREYWADGSVNWFKTQELVDSWLFDADEKISEKGLENSSAKLFPENTIVMAIYASPTLGRLGILTKESTFNQAALGLVANGDFVSYEWLYLKLFELRDKFNAIASGAGQQNINVKIVQTKEIVVPSHDVMGKFTEIIHPYFEKQKNLTEQIIYLQKARDALLPRLMNGGEGLKLEGGAV